MRLDNQLSALATMTPALLRREWRQRFKTPPPAIGPTLLALGIAFHLQERAFGSAPRGQAKQLVRLARQVEQGSLADDPGATLKVGTRLVRDWQGEPHQVLIRDDGFVYRDRLYRSLTPIARAITGSNWSGPRFFGVKGRATVGGGDHG